MEINECRSRIDELDNQILKLFLERMALANDIAQYKKAHDLEVLDTGREQEILNRVSTQAGAEFAESARTLFLSLFDISRSYQRSLLSTDAPTAESYEEASSLRSSTSPAQSS